MELHSNPSVRKGGVVWLVVAILVALAWQSPMELWPTFLISWVIVGIAWISVKGMKRTLSREDAVGGILALAIVAVIAWLFGLGFERYNALLFNSFVWDSGVLVDMSETDVQPTALLICMALSLMMAGIAAAWLISTVLPSAARNNGVNPFPLLLRSVRQLKSSGALGQVVNFIGSIIVVAVMISYSSELPVKIAMGLLIAYTQIRFLAHVERPKLDRKANRTNDQARSRSNNERRGALIALFSLQLVFALFYVALFGLWYGWSWKVASLYPLSWLFGAFYALIAGLFAQVKVLYILLMILITLACALLLGMIVGIYGMEILA